MNGTGTPPPATRAADPRTARVARFYETLSRSSLGQAGTVYADDARFIDPFNDVQGLPAVQRVLAHMFDSLEAPRFEVLQSLTDGDQAMLRWHFHFRRPGSAQAWRLHGVTHLVYGADGRISLHHDHWDAASQLYERLPLLGPVLRWLRRRLGTPAGP